MIDRNRIPSPYDWSPEVRESLAVTVEKERQEPPPPALRRTRERSLGEVLSDPCAYFGPIDPDYGQTP